LIEFVENYKQRLSYNQISREESRKIMQKANPKFVLRNYLLFECIAEMEEGKTELFDKLWLLYKILTKKFIQNFR
jgi:uncharacterized protein YdiU (UPF0061 family)